MNEYKGLNDKLMKKYNEWLASDKMLKCTRCYFKEAKSELKKIFATLVCGSEKTSERKCKEFLEEYHKYYSDYQTDNSKYSRYAYNCICALMDYGQDIHIYEWYVKEN